MTNTCKYLLFIFALYHSRLFAQAAPREQLVQAAALVREGNTGQAITTARSLIDAKSLTETDSAKAWDVLGLAYEKKEDFGAAQRAYEEALRLLRGDNANARDYAEVLSDFGDLYCDIGHCESATGLYLKALHVYEELSDHTGIARSLSDLAGNEFSLKHNSNGKRYLKHAFDEMKNAPDMGDDDRAVIYELRGWSAELDGNAPAALSEYRYALQLWEHLHGDKHPYTGWGHVLLGKVYSELGDIANAQDQFRSGLSILGEVFSTESIRYLTAEITYSRLLDQTGAHEQATQLRNAAEAKIRERYRTQCVSCLISADAVR
jgi:tetratricopeptide (TPR) repeat protein